MAHGIMAHMMRLLKYIDWLPKVPSAIPFPFSPMRSLTHKSKMLLTDVKLMQEIGN